MSGLRKIFILLLSCVFIVFVGMSFSTLLNEGYIPFTEEYDCRLYKQYYEENKSHFEFLMEEIRTMNNNALKTSLF